MEQNKMSWKNKILCPSITKCPQEMAKHDFRSFGASDKNHFYHLYWACILGANGGDRWRKIKCHGKMKYCVLASPNDHRRWTNTILEHLAIVTKIIFITSIGLVPEGLMELIDGAK